MADGDYDQDGIPDSQDSDFHDSDGDGIPDEHETDSGRRDSSGLETVILDGQELYKIEGIGGILYLNSDREVVATQEPDGDIRLEKTGETLIPMNNEVGWDQYHGTDGTILSQVEGITGLVELGNEGGRSSETSNNSGTLVFDESPESASGSNFDAFWNNVGVYENQHSEKSSSPQPKPVATSRSQSRYDEYSNSKNVTSSPSNNDVVLFVVFGLMFIALIVMAIFALMLVLS